NHASLDRQIVKADETPRQGNILSTNTDIAPSNPPVLDELRGDKLRRTHGNREADSLRRQDHCRVDANHFSTRRDQRTTRIAWVQRRVSLNEIVDQAS